MNQCFSPLTLARIGSREGPAAVPVEASLTALAVLPFGVMLTVVANATTAVPRGFPQAHVEVTGISMPITLAGWEDK